MKVGNNLTIDDSFQCLLAIIQYNKDGLELNEIQFRSRLSSFLSNSARAKKVYGGDASPPHTKNHSHFLKKGI